MKTNKVMTVAAALPSPKRFQDGLVGWMAKAISMITVVASMNDALSIVKTVVQLV